MNQSKKHILTTITRTALISLSVLALAGCIDDADVCTPAPPGGTQEWTPEAGVSLSFTLSAGRGERWRSRADNCDGDQQGSAAEEYIDLDDMQFMLFDGDQRFLRHFRPTITVDAAGAYTATATINEPYFDNNINSSSIRFYILALANGSTMGSSWVNVEPGTTIADLCSASQSSVLTKQPIPSVLIQNHWFTDPDPYMTQIQRFPMSGLQHFTVSGAALKASTEARPVDLSAGAGGRTLNMLRSLAKIEVIDHVNYVGKYSDAFENDPCRIEKVEIDGIVNRGLQLPLYSYWSSGVTYPVTQQVTDASIPMTATYQNPPKFVAGDNNIPGDQFSERMRIEFTYDTDAQNNTVSNPDGAPVFTGYMYEYSDHSDILAVSQQPYIRITTISRDGIQGQVLPFRLGYYNSNGTFSGNYIPEILRNHIYRYEIRAISGFEAEVTLTVLDWDVEETVWDYSENVGITTEGSIRWTESTVAELRPANASVVLRQGASTAECSFTIDTPRGATWRAMFVPESGNRDAFAFVGADGSQVSEISGEVNGTRTVLQIQPTSPATKQTNRARLQVIVVGADGRTMTADVCNGQYGDNKYFTIIQNSQL